MSRKQREGLPERLVGVEPKLPASNGIVSYDDRAVYSEAPPEMGPAHRAFIGGHTDPTNPGDASYGGRKNFGAGHFVEQEAAKAPIVGWDAKLPQPARQPVERRLSARPRRK